MKINFRKGFYNGEDEKRWYVVCFDEDRANEDQFDPYEAKYIIRQLKKYDIDAMADKSAMYDNDVSFTFTNKADEAFFVVWANEGIEI